MHYSLTILSISRKTLWLSHRPIASFWFFFRNYRLFNWFSHKNPYAGMQNKQKRARCRFVWYNMLDTWNWGYVWKWAISSCHLSCHESLFCSQTGCRATFDFTNKFMQKLIKNIARIINATRSWIEWPLFFFFWYLMIYYTNQLILLSMRLLLLPPEQVIIVKMCIICNENSS